MARKKGVKTPDGISAPLVDELIASARNGEGVATHFNSPREIILNRPNLAFRILSTVEKARRSSISAENLGAELPTALIATGLFREKSRTYVIKSPIYKAYFDDKWLASLRRSIGSEIELRSVFLLLFFRQAEENACASSIPAA